MTVLFLVRHGDGTYARSAPEDVLPDDVLILDGPESAAALDGADAALAAEIDAAGGLEQWRTRLDVAQRG